MESEESEQLDKLLSLGQKTVAMFYADWCPFCKRFKPVFESVKSKYKKIQLKLNEDENPMWDKFAISAVPTVIAFEGNKIVARKDARMGIGLEKSDIDSLLQELNWN
ncbi:MAG TPA: thioredoxin family protein [Nitrososphaeraceae archaeon]|nr:thioredoxin family protein [Nitrososphaeraceae archaeon]